VGQLGRLFCYTPRVDHAALPAWTMLPFGALVLGVAVLPAVAPHLWEKRWFQAVLVLVCATPVAAYLLLTGHSHEVLGAARSYAGFVCTLGALFVTAGGVYATGDLEATPRTNTLFILAGSVLASFIGTTGASVLVIRPLLRTNQQRAQTAHLVPFFILAVANAGGLLTPLGDPPLLIGFIEGVPFFWTLRLLPVWVLYVGSISLAFYLFDRRAFARETGAAHVRDRLETRALEVRGKHNLLWLVAIVAVAFLPSPWRELAMVGIALASYFGTRRDVHELNAFSLGPILEVAIVFAGIFACLVPVERALSTAAPALPLKHGWQLFWACGLLSSLLDNAPTYAAFAALARGLGAGGGELVAGVAAPMLAAISAGSVVMGATTYIGNGPNLMVKAIAERAGYPMPSFMRYALFAFLVMLPAHLLMTGALIWLER